VPDGLQLEALGPGLAGPRYDSRTDSGVYVRFAKPAHTSLRVVARPTVFYFYFYFIFIYPIYRAKMYIYVTRTIGCVDSERAVARSVTVLFLLGLWLFAFPALVWGAIGGDFVYNYSR